MIKALKKQGTEGTFLNVIKAIYDRPIVNIIINGEKLKTWDGIMLQLL
jgi:vacuolar-type H+-ATPase subunit C/Vma6